MYEHSLEHVNGFEHVKVLDRADSDSALKTMVNYIYDTRKNHKKTKFHENEQNDEYVQVTLMKLSGHK